MLNIAKQTVAHNTDNFFLHSPSDVDFRYDGSKSHTAVIDNKWEIKLDRRSAINGQLQLGVNKDQLKDQFLGGSFFIVDDAIIDHRLKDDLKFVHKDDAIKLLAATLGFAKAVQKPNIWGMIDLDHAEGHGRPIARSQTEKFECNATESLGGQFDIMIGFSWSPFDIDIHSFIEMWRQVCENGAIAQSSLMNHRIPMLNKWEENLAISNQVIRHSFDKVVFPRLQALPSERISLSDMASLLTIVRDQKASKQLQSDSIAHLSIIEDKLTEAWEPAANSLKKSILKFIPAPITAFDAMNIATEISTHHVARDRTNARAQAFVSGLIFDEVRQRNLNTNLDSLVIESETFGQVDQAFFGVTSH